MKAKTRQTTEYFCNRCGKWWTPKRGNKPNRCGKCKSPYWATKRKAAKK